MTSATSLSLLVRPRAAGWHRALLFPPAWPVSRSLLAAWRDVCAELQARLFGDPSRVIAGLQMWRLHVGGIADTLSRKAREWAPEIGVGVWLDQPPPTLWTEEEFLKNPPGVPMRPPMYQFIRVSPADRDYLAVWREVGGNGCWLAFSVQSDPDGFVMTEAAAYKAWIEEPSIEAYDLFVPLLKLDSSESPLFADRSRHLAGVTRYVRESDEDRGLVIYSDVPIEPVFESLARLVPAGHAAGGAAYTVIPDPETRP